MRLAASTRMIRQAPGASQAATGESRAPGLRLRLRAPGSEQGWPRNAAVPAPQHFGVFRRSKRLTDPGQLPTLDGHHVEAALGPATASKA